MPKKETEGADEIARMLEDGENASPTDAAKIAFFDAMMKPTGQGTSNEDAEDSSRRGKIKKYLKKTGIEE
jgi:hypothetical protein